MRVLFICTGNTCRSPMAEAMFRQLANRHNVAAEARSAGVAALDGQPINPHSASILQAKGIRDQHASSSVTKELVEWADVVLTMSLSHKKQVIQQYPEAVDKTYTLKEYADTDQDIANKMRELEMLYAEWHAKIAMSQQPTEAERLRLLELERSMPSLDIDDPFGGSDHDYRRSAQEIEDALVMLIMKLKTQ